ncbi:MAG: TadE family protein [Anaerolineales bacterium]|nr:TadE family protein [Anaerolineales bacterium]
MKREANPITKATRPRATQRGQSLTELAITLTILLTLMAGVLDIGRAYYTFLALRDAAAEGAAYGSFDPTNSTEIENRVRRESPGGMISWDNATITTTIIGQACRGGGVEVTVEVPYTLLTPFIGAIAGSQTLPLEATVVNTILSPACP